MTERLTGELLILMPQSNQLLCTKDMAAELLALRAALRLARRFVETETKYPAPGSRPETAAVVLATIDAALREPEREERPAEQILEERFPYLKDSRP